MKQADKSNELTVDGLLVKAAIIESHKTLQEAADMMGVQYATLSNKISGWSSFTLNDMIALTRITGKPIDWFLKKR